MAGHSGNRAYTAQGIQMETPTAKPSYYYKLIMMETWHEVVVVCWIDDNRGGELEVA